MQFKVPQNIDLEDKIIGPLTLIQFVYLMAGGMIIYIAYSTLSTGLFLVIAIPVGLISLALTFLKVQDQPFSHFVSSLALYVVKPRKRVWRKLPEMETSESIIKNDAAKKDEKKIYKGKTISQTNLEELSYVLDTRGLGELKTGTSKENKTVQKPEVKTPNVK